MQKQPFPVRGGGEEKVWGRGGGVKNFRTGEVTFAGGGQYPVTCHVQWLRSIVFFCINKAKLFAKGFSKHIVCTPLFCWEVQPPTKFSKEGGLTGPQPVEAGCWEREGRLFLLKKLI